MTKKTTPRKRPLAQKKVDPIEKRLTELREAQKANNERLATLRNETAKAEIQAHQFAAAIGELEALQKTKGS